MYLIANCLFTTIQTVFLDELKQLPGRVDSQAVVSICLVNIDCLRADVQLLGNGFDLKATDDKQTHFNFPVGELTKWILFGRNGQIVFDVLAVIEFVFTHRPDSSDEVCSSRVFNRDTDRHQCSLQQTG